MSLSARIENELDRLASTGAGQGDLQLQVEEGELHVRFQTVDKLACELEDFRYTDTRLAESSIDDLQQRATQLAKRLSYLLEAISPVEIDNEACVVQMRSNPPEQDEVGSKYYELVVCREEIRLSRYHKSAGQPRQIVPATITREVFLRLATDITTAAG